MMCNELTIKEMLPAYAAKALDEKDMHSVEAHLAACGDCRAELEIIRLMAAETVPDPGEAFWDEMPDRVYRAVQRHRSDERSIVPAGVSRILEWFVLPRWALGAAAVGVVVLVSWLLVRPAPMTVPRTALPESDQGLEELLTQDPVNVADMSDSELAKATVWAKNELAPMGEAVGEDTSGNADQDISQDLSDMSPQELDRMYQMLQKKEKELKDRHNKQTKEEKRVG